MSSIAHPAHNLFSIFQQRFPADRSRALLIDACGDRLSYAHMEARSAQVANYFLALGLQPGDRVAVQVEKSSHALLCYLAAVRAGLVYLPLNTAYQPGELTYFINDAEPALIICDPARHAVFAKILRDSSAHAATAAIATLDALGAGSLFEHADECAITFANAAVEPDTVLAILYTSGTTGRPKGAMLSHRNLSSNALMLHDYWGWSSNDVLLHVLPIFHVHGLFVAIHGVLMAGASMIFLPNFDTSAVRRALPQASIMMGVPTYYTRLLADPDFGAADCASMRLFISGSAPLLATTHREFEQRSGHRILERYGMSETAMLISNPLHGERRAGSVGFPLPGVEVRIVDTKGVAVVDDNVSSSNVGSIEVRGPNVFRGYWRQPEKTAQEFTADGFFITGDQAQISADGYISIVGRASDMVISGGYNVYPKEVEQVLDSIPGVAESAVFGIADADLGEKVVAVVVRNEITAVSAEEIISAARQQLAAYKIPKAVHFIEQMPRNTMGKVQKKILRENFFSR